MFEAVTSYTWPNDGISFASLGMRVDDLANRLGLPVHAWDVDGLGPARGFGFRVPTGRVYLLEELEMAVRYHGATGPSVYVDALDLATLGAKALIQEVVTGLGLQESDIAFVADSDLQKQAANVVAIVAASRAAGSA
jgi:hypothetical protein